MWSIVIAYGLYLWYRWKEGMFSICEGLVVDCNHVATLIIRSKGIYHVTANLIHLTKLKLTSLSLVRKIKTQTREFGEKLKKPGPNSSLAVNFGLEVNRPANRVRKKNQVSFHRNIWQL